MVNLTIDNKKISVPEGTSIMEAARKNGIYIPGFCYHPKLDSFGACRVCIVHVTERGRTKDKFACAQPVSEGMEVQTKSDKIDKYVKSVTEYLLIHHPLDCPICDKAGECELQDVTFKFCMSKGRIETARKNEPSVKDNPVLEFNHNRCILCGRCTRVCSEVQGIAAIDFQKRGFFTEIGTPLRKPLNCEFCGQCLSVCPVGAIQDRVFNFKGRPWEFTNVQTTCTYCSVGCTLFLNTKNDSVARVTSDDDTGFNNGNLCSKGRFGFQFIESENRIREPLIKNNGKLEPTTWENALEVVSNKLVEIKQQHGADSIAGIGSEKCTNEENYLFQRFFRTVIGTNNIDNPSNIKAPYLNKLLIESVSNGICGNTLEDVYDADMIMLFGVDIVEELPVAGNIIRKAIKKNNASLVIANIRNVDFKSVAQNDYRVKYTFGSESAFINALIKVMIDEHMVDTSSIERSVDNFNDLKDFLDNSDTSELLNAAGVSKEQILELTKCLVASNKAHIFAGKNLLSNSCGETTLRSLMNLAYVLKYGNGKNDDDKSTINLFFPREHNNSQGVNDMGVVPDFLPGYQDISDSNIRDKFKIEWAGSETDQIPENATIKEGAIFDQAIQGKIKAMYIVGDNPVLTHADGSEARQAINNLDFTVVQDSFLTETGHLADVVLPSATFAEKIGTFSNIGRTIQKVNKALDPIGNAKTDCQIISDIAEKMGCSFNFDSSESIMDEINELVPIYSQVKYSNINCKGFGWFGNVPVKSSPEFKIFSAKKEQNDNFEKQYPFVLATGNIMFHLGTYSSNSKVLNEIYPACFAEISPEDAKANNIENDDTVELIAPNSVLRLKVKITKKSPKGVVFVPSGCDFLPVNLLIDKNSVPRVKVVKVIS